MPPFETTSTTVGHARRCEDRTFVREFEDGVLIGVADGAGGTGSGDLAAETVVRELSLLTDVPRPESGWTGFLSRVDQRVAEGESTGVVVARTNDGIVGASVGDSQAWLFEDGELVDLTRFQCRKPLLGSGVAAPTGFSRPASGGLLLVATDGFCNYVRRKDLLKEILWIGFEVLASRLVEMVRLPSGDLWDDVGIVACRPRRTPRKRRRFTIE